MAHEQSSLESYLLASLALLACHWHQWGLIAVDILELALYQAVNSAHKGLSIRLRHLSILKRHLVERHHLQGKVRYSFQKVFTERIGELPLGYPLQLNQLLHFSHLILQNIDNRLILLMQAHLVLLHIPSYSVGVTLLIGQSESKWLYLRQGKKAFLKRLR